MRFFRTKLFILILLATAGATFYYFGDTEKLLSSSMEALNNTPLEGVAQKVQSISTQKDSSEEKTSFDLDNVIQNAEEEFSQFKIENKNNKKKFLNTIKNYLLDRYDCKMSIDELKSLLNVHFSKEKEILQQDLKIKKFKIKIKK